MKVFVLALTIMALTSCTQLEQRKTVASQQEIEIPKQSGEDLNALMALENSGIVSIKTKKPAPKRILVRNPTPPKKISKLSRALKKYCKRTDKAFHRWGWGRSNCKNQDWNHVRSSVLGTPLPWVVYGNEATQKEFHKDTTLVMCTVHGDEITPLKFCYDIISYLNENYDKFYTDKLIVVAPLVCPDCFFKKYPSRTNHRRVDLNRNFPTKDWSKDAQRLWVKRYKKDKRRFPGHSAKSEPGTIFQVNLVKRYRPNKIISVHAPLTLIDYDGPVDKSKNKLTGHGLLANTLLLQMSQQAKGYKIKDYPYFTGSLGNWAGIERRIPTYTLELPSADNRRHREFWKTFKKAIHAAFLKDLRSAEKIRTSSFVNNSSE